MCEFKLHGDTRIDPCMREIVEFINKETRFETIMCCCGHGRYPPSIVAIDTRTAEWSVTPTEIFTRFQFKHGQKRFYKRDKKNHYFIPEVQNEKR